MDYPNNFNIPAFPAGKTIALARSVSIWISIVFFLIIAACGFVILGIYYKTNYPFLISVDPITNEWSTVAYPKSKDKDTHQQYKFIQEKLVSDFVVNWFTISSDEQINNARWAECSVDDCDDPEQFNPENLTCALACKSNTEVFREFRTKVMPQYKAMIEQASETWRVKKQILPIVVSESSSKWQVYATVQSAVMGQFQVLVFVDVARDINLYPATFGYYIKQFNSYRISQ